MDNYADAKDFELLEQDKYTYSILSMVLKDKCDLVQTDHENIILCHSQAPYPVWLWTSDNCTDATKGTAWQLSAKYRPLSSGYRFNVKYDTAEYFIGKGRQENINVGIISELLAYDCPSPVEPDIVADGELYCCTTDDLTETVGLIKTFYTDIGEKHLSDEHYTEKAKDCINNKAFFIWKNALGETAACCSYDCGDSLATMGCVYTMPKYRRMHYAQNLVYQVTKIAAENGFIPMLYTDANYPASNACYEKIGYIRRGRLCTIAII